MQGEYFAIAVIRKTCMKQKLKRFGNLGNVLPDLNRINEIEDVRACI